MDPTNSTRIALGRPLETRNHVPCIDLRNGKIAFIPGRSMRDIFATTEAPFPPGACLEYRIETGDMYFDGDRGMTLNQSLWVIEPDGTRKLLARDYNIYVNFNIAAVHLKRVGIPFQVVKVYDGPKGEHVETEVKPSIARSRRQLTFAVMAGTSSLWLGALAGFFLRDVGLVIAAGIVSYAVFAVVSMRSSIFKRTVLLNLIATLPSYAGGYALAVVCARYIFRG